MKKRLNVNTIRNKIKKVGREGLFKYEQDYYRKKRRDKADHLAQKYPKLVAFKDTDRVRCLTCPKMMTREDCNGCHRIEKKANGSYRCRREERNIYPCCEQCNNWNKQTHTRRLTEHVTKIYGQEQVAKRQAEDRKTHKRPSRDEIDAVIKHYTQLIDDLEEPVDNSDFIDSLLAEIK